MYMQGCIILSVVTFVTVSAHLPRAHVITRCVKDACESGVGLYPHCDDCTKFIYCVFGHAVEKQCPHNLMFDIKLGVCNFPRDTLCWDASQVNNIGLPGHRSSGANGASSRQSNDESSRFYFPNGRPDAGETLKTGESVDELSSKLSRDASPQKQEEPQIPNRPNGDVSSSPVSLMTDDPPAPVDVNNGADGQSVNRLGPDGDVSAIPVSLMTDDPPAPANVNDGQNVNKLVPDGDVSAIPVSLMTDDPPAPANVNDGQNVNKLVPDGDVSAIPVSLMTDDPPEPANINDRHNVNKLVPDGDVSAIPVSLQTDDPPAPANVNNGADGQNVNRLGPDGDVSSIPVSLQTDDPPVGLDGDGHETQAPAIEDSEQLVNQNADGHDVNKLAQDGDVSAIPASLRTDDPPVGLDEDGHETQAPAIEDNKPNGGKLGPDGDVSPVPVSMRTDDPPVGLDEDGHETQAPAIEDNKPNADKLGPDGDDSPSPVSMRTDDPPSGFDADGHETRIGSPADQQDETKNSQSQEEPIIPNRPDGDVSSPPILVEEPQTGAEVPDVNNNGLEVEEEVINNEDAKTQGTEDPPEEWNRDYTINPDLEGKGSSEQALGKVQGEANPQDPASNLPETGAEASPNNDPGTGGEASHSKSFENMNTNLGNLFGGSLNLPNFGGLFKPGGQSGDTGTVDKQGTNQSQDGDQSTAPLHEVPCVIKCEGLPTGNYQACESCTTYVSCMMGIQFIYKCPTDNFWDDISKLCVNQSTTCVTK